MMVANNTLLTLLYFSINVKKALKTCPGACLKTHSRHPHSLLCTTKDMIRTIYPKFGIYSLYHALYGTSHGKHFSDTLWYYSEAYLIMHGYLSFHATDQLRMNVYFPDTGERQPVPAGIPVPKSGNL